MFLKSWIVRGEWYFDKQENKIFYWPEAGLDVSNASCEGVVLKNLIEMKGTEESPVQNISIEGIKFEVGFEIKYTI